MSISGLIDRIDDWINPIVVKELRQAVKSRLVTGVLLLFLSVQLVIMGMYLAFQDASARGAAARKSSRCCRASCWGRAWC